MAFYEPKKLGGCRAADHAESAQEIASLGRELHKRLVTFSRPLSQLGKSLNTAVNRYNEAVASYDARVIPHLRKIEDAGAGSGRELPEMTQVETATQTITAAVVEEGDPSNFLA